MERQIKINPVGISAQTEFNKLLSLEITKCYGCGGTPCSDPATCNKSLVEMMSNYQIQFMTAMRKAEEIKPVYSSYRGVIFDMWGSPRTMRLGNPMYEDLNFYKKRPLLIDEVFAGVPIEVFDMGNWWAKRLSGKHVFTKHQRYLKQVLNMFKLK